MALLLTLATAGAAVVALANRPEVVGMLTNADLLLPAALASDVFRHGVAALQFQLPRVPSLVPDIAAVLLLDGASGGWRPAMLAYACGAAMALVAAGGAVASALAGRSPAAGAAAVLGLTAALLGVFWPSGVVQPYLLALAPAVHSGSFILALAALLLARDAMRRAGMGRLAWLGSIAAAGVLSDKLFVGAFLLPLLAALGVSVRLGQLARKPAMRVAWVALAGIAVGWIADRLLFARLLRREPDVALLSPDAPDHIRLFLHQPMLPFLAAATLVIWSLPLMWRERTPARVFWWTVAASVPPLFLGLTAILYVDQASLRYLQPALWLPLFAAAGLLLSIPAAGRALPTVATASVAMWVALQPRPRPAILTWHDPLAACLRQGHARGLLHDGLAGYRLARPLEAASDWSLQVDQIAPEGEAYLWGNNRHWYGHARDAPARPPDTDFIVAAQLDGAAVTALYGAPASILACPDSPVWLYPPGRLHAALWDASFAALGANAVVRPTCLSPAAFLTRAGRLPAAPIAMPADATPLTVGSFGPYLDLKAGRWRMSLRYRLVSPTGGARWQVTSNTGKQVLRDGSLVATGDQAATVEIALDPSRRTVNVELRTLLGPGDRFQLIGVEVAPADVATRPCNW